MKNTFTFFQMSLLICGVFGVGADEVKTVMEGDSVTLNSDVTETQRISLMLWRFGDKGPAIAQIIVKAISYPSYIDIFKGKLQLDQTGSLTIKNMRTKHSGLYQLQIDLNSRPSYMMKFNVTVYESPSVVDAGEAEMKSVSVMEGYSVPLQTDVTEPHGDELIVWRFGDVGKLIVKHDTEAKSLTNYADERFRDRLKLDHQTGSLTITDTRTTDTGLYTVKISSNKQTLYRRFIVTVSDPGLSPGAVAGIVIGVLLLVWAAAAAAAAAAVIYHRRKTSELESQKLKIVSVLEGDDVTLNTDVTKIQKDDLIEWRVGDGGPLTAALIRGSAHMYYTALDERFTVRLDMDLQSGSLIIKKSRNTDSGLYQLMIRQDGKIIYRKFYVSVFVTNEVRNISVKEGKSMILNSETEIQKDDQILWRFGDKEILIAELRGGTVETHDGVADGIFRGRLKLDDKTGSLIITDMKIKHAGDYKLQIISSRGTTDKTFVVTVYSSLKSVTEGESITLNPGTEIQKDDLIQWMFGDILIAEVRGTGETHDDDGRFRGRLTLDETTGSLTIARMRDEHTGYYKLQISSSRGNTNKRFKVVVVCSGYTSETVLEGENVTLSSDTHIVNDEVKWLFNDKILATGKNGAINKTTYCNEIFEDRLNLDHETGSLNINDTRTSYSGVYHLKVSTLGIDRRFHVAVNDLLDSLPPPSWKLLEESAVNDSAAVQMPPVNEEDPDLGNKQEGMSLLVMR